MEHSDLVREMRQFVDRKNKLLVDMLDKLGWKLDDLKKIVQECRGKMVICPVVSDHTIPESNSRHIERCEIKYGSYPFEPGLVSPRTYQLLTSVKSTDELKKSDVIPDSKNVFTFDQGKSDSVINSSTQLIELLASERDAKRRRATHRGKNVHTNKKTYSEILREVINSQMETLHLNVDSTDSTTESEHKGPTITDKINLNENRYLGVGIIPNDENPYKLWQKIEQQEQLIIRQMNQHDERSSQHSNSGRKRNYSRSKSPTDQSDYRRYNISQKSHHHDNWRRSSRSRNRSQISDYRRHSSFRTHDSSSSQKSIKSHSPDSRSSSRKRSHTRQDKSVSGECSTHSSRKRCRNSEESNSYNNSLQRKSSKSSRGENSESKYKSKHQRK